MIFIGLIILVDLFKNRKKELIWFEHDKFTFRNGDAFRLFFLLPFLLLGVSLTFYILSLFWYLFSILEIAIVIIIAMFIIFFIKQNPRILENLSEEK